MPRKRSDLSRYSRAARRVRNRRANESNEHRKARLAAVHERQALTLLPSTTYAMAECFDSIQYHHFTPDQFESNRADGLVKLKPNAIPTIFYEYKAPVVHNAPAKRKKHHFTPDQFESNRADGLVKLKPNAIPTIFYEYKAPVVHNAPAKRKKAVKRQRRCNVAGCRSNYGSHSETVCAFPLPRNRRLKNKWLRKIPNDISRLKKPVICIKHFRENCLVRTQQCIVDGEGAPKLKPNAVPTIFPKQTTKNQSLQRQRTSRKSHSDDNKKNKPHSHSQKSQRAVKTISTAQGNEIFTDSITEMLEVDLNPHICSVNIKQEPEDFENTEFDGCMSQKVDLYTQMCTVTVKQESEDHENGGLDGCVNEEFAEHPLITAECGVIIKQEPEVELDADTVGNDASGEPFQTPVCSDIIREKPGSTIEAAGAEENVNTFVEAFVPDWCPPSIKQEEVSDYFMLEL